MSKPSRRTVLGAGAMSPLWLLGCDSSGESPHTDAGVDAPGSCAPTVANIEGPFFLPGAPERSVLITPETPGKRLRISGRVFESLDCSPLNFAQLQVWQANAQGEYDNKGFDLRGQFGTSPEGRFEFATIMPGLYSTRPSHIHVKVSAFGHQPLTTQLYFEGDPRNENDPFIHSSLVMKLQPEPDGSLSARFDFALAPI